ncbi:hypothetical protein B0T17DRAFT_542166 [Bombardia bombarda]|uniref:GST N-terminal domain-containing protein n=1 Tax=Bombardia bombarda TaxID=252184 RepID=A0AA39U7R2_9PEZI|nr:hypothetical protein B0T17DRAFT_542166 [Bombardia bombarda]
MPGVSGVIGFHANHHHHHLHGYPNTSYEDQLSQPDATATAAAVAIASSAVAVASSAASAGVAHHSFRSSGQTAMPGETMNSPRAWGEKELDPLLASKRPADSDVTGSHLSNDAAATAAGAATGLASNDGSGGQGEQKEMEPALNSGRPLVTRLVENPPTWPSGDRSCLIWTKWFETYFPWVDNVYSHRSTQQYKRRSVVTHYWDCRMKGRPPGTPKSNDPNKKKRKRLARERGLCDVKIKITEVGEAGLQELQGISSSMDAAAGGGKEDQSALGEMLLACKRGRPFWTIQRVNGISNANGNGAVADGQQRQPAAHKHTLEKSDVIKKNSVQRWLAARDKDVKKRGRPVRSSSGRPAAPVWKPTGDAAVTARKHAKDSEIEFYGACFCPFSQRVWIALEAKGLPYQYCETDPFCKPKSARLLEANPRGLVPAIRQGDWACGESAVILEYLEEIDSTILLHPTDARLKAFCRLWIDFINAKLVPSFFALLAMTEEQQPSRAQGLERLQRDLTSLVQAAEEEVWSTCPSILAFLIFQKASANQ